jgi:hypothetical protein
MGTSKDNLIDEIHSLTEKNKELKQKNIYKFYT